MENGALVLVARGLVLRKGQAIMKAENPMADLTTGKVILQNQSANTDNLVLHSNAEIPPKAMGVIKEALEIIAKSKNLKRTRGI